MSSAAHAPAASSSGRAQRGGGGRFRSDPTPPARLVLRPDALSGILEPEEPMPVTVKIPAPLRPLTQGQAEVALENAPTVKAAVEELARRYPGLRERLLDDKGALRRYVNIFRNDEDIRHGKMLDTSLGAEDKLTIVPAIAGG